MNWLQLVIAGLGGVAGYLLKFYLTGGKQRKSEPLRTRETITEISFSV
jgi:hypothetical protein